MLEFKDEEQREKYLTGYFDDFKKEPNTVDYEGKFYRTEVWDMEHMFILCNVPEDLKGKELEEYILEKIKHGRGDGTEDLYTCAARDGNDEENYNFQMRYKVPTNEFISLIE
jgi:hypothetical protein